MKYLLLFFFFNFALSGEQFYNISSDIAILESGCFALQNNIQIENEFGKIYAKEASMEDVDKNHFKLNLKGGVQIFFKNGATLKCESAQFDSQKSQINFASPNGKITYEDTILDKNKNKQKIYLSCKYANCLLPQKNFDKLTLKDFSSLTFEDDLYFQYGENFSCHAGRAAYSTDDMQISSLLLYADEKSTVHIEYEKNIVEANFAKIDINEQNIIMQNAKGSILSSSKFPINAEFFAKHLSWNNFNKTLSLKENVFINYEDSGKLASDEVQIIRKGFSNEIFKVVAKGATTITLINKNKDILSELTCMGIITLDHDQNQIQAHSSEKDSFITYHDNLITISSKNAFLSYDKGQKLKNLLLEDSVQFIYKKTSKTTGYGIAEIVTYNPENKFLSLKSKDSQKVLFWEDSDGIRLSAKEIVIDQKNKDSIKGVGDVRFILNMEEETRIKQIFARYLHGETDDEESEYE